MISFIVPVRYHKNDYVYKRALELISLFETFDKDIELVISDASKIKMLHTYSEKIKIVNLEYTDDIYSPAKARNACIEYCVKEFLFFLDVDLFFSEVFISSLFDVIKEKILFGEAQFIMLPCLYLSELGTKDFDNSSNKKKTIDLFRDSYIYGNNIYVERLAVNTSAIVLRREYFIKIDMFSEEFCGHGGEDFELLHRLASYNPHSMKNHNYYHDKVEQFITDYKGFRQYLSLYSFEYLFSDLLIVHRWHKRELFNKFYMKRVGNENLLIQKMKHHDSNDSLWKSNEPFVKYEKYLESLLLSQGYDLKKAIGFKKLKDDIFIRRPLSAKIRKLITRPKLFFIDMLKNKIT